MNKDELAARLAQQRKWRTSTPAPVSAPAQRKLSKKQASLFFFYAVMILMSVVVTAFVGYFGWILYRNAEASPIPSPATGSLSTATGVASNEGITSLTVCAGGFETAKLHVRFMPDLNSDVRGYLNEGETVTVLMDPQGKPITRTIDGVSWTLIELPINGWVSTSHLCQ